MKCILLWFSFRSQIFTCHDSGFFWYSYKTTNWLYHYSKSKMSMHFHEIWIVSFVKWVTAITDLIAICQLHPFKCNSSIWSIYDTYAVKWSNRSTNIMLVHFIDTSVAHCGMVILPFYIEHGFRSTAWLNNDVDNKRRYWGGLYKSDWHLVTLLKHAA